MKSKQLYSAVVFCMFIIWGMGTSMAEKDRAPVTIDCRAVAKTRQISVLGIKITEQYWLTGITFRNDGNENFQVDVAKFSVLGSDGYSVNYSNIPEIPANRLLVSSTVHPRETIYGEMGFKLKSTNAQPVYIIYNTTFLTATARINIVQEQNTRTQSAIKEESPYSASRAQVQPTVPVKELSPEEKELQRVRTKANKEATLAKDSVISESQMEITNKYIKLQDDNKKEYEDKKIKFDDFMNNKDKLERQKTKETIDIQEHAKQVFDDTYTRVTADYYRQKK
jgi:hypothetical protein